MDNAQEIIPATNEQAVAPINTAPMNVTNIWVDKDAFEQTQRVAIMLSKSQMIPEKYQNKPQDCFVAIEMAARAGLSPLAVLQNVDVVKGKPRWSGQACMAIITPADASATLIPSTPARKGLTTALASSERYGFPTVRLSTEPKSP